MPACKRLRETMRVYSIDCLPGRADSSIDSGTMLRRMIEGLQPIVDSSVKRSLNYANRRADLREKILASICSNSHLSRLGNVPSDVPRQVYLKYSKIASVMECSTTSTIGLFASRERELRDDHWRGGPIRSSHQRQARRMTMCRSPKYLPALNEVGWWVRVVQGGKPRRWNSSR
jgi:hypothetical protein